MIYGSVCSGIESASVAWGPLGWRAAFLSEIAPFPRAVLQHRFPGVPLHGDFQTIQKGDYEPIDVLVGGTPCQDFSVAGLREGLAGERGNLTLEFIRLAQRLRPTWIVFENVPGLLSDDGGRAFGAFLGGLAVIGYGFAYRVLDAQFAGLAQRRERVFVVGYLGDWRPAAAVLFERHGLSWHPAPRRGARQRVAGSLTTRAGNGSRPAGANGNLVADIAGTLSANGKAAATATGQDAAAGLLVPLGLGDDGELARALNACHTASGRHDVSVDTFVATALRARDQSRGVDSDATDTLIPTIGFNARQDPDSWEERAGPLDTRSPQGQAIAFDTTQITNPDNRSNPQPGDPCHPLAASGHPPAIAFQDRFRGDDGRGYDRPPPVMEEQTGTLETVKPWNVAYEQEQEGGVTEFLPQSSRVYLEDGVAPTLQGTGTRNGQRTPAVAFQTRVARNGRGQPEEEIVPALNGSDAGATSDMRPCVAYPAVSFQERGREGGRSLETQEDIAYALTNPGAGSRTQERNLMTLTMAVRRLTPREAERLQGFPDDFTRIPVRHYKQRRITPLRPADRWDKAEDGWLLMAADGPRYQVLGNSMPVPWLRWLGERIDLVMLLLQERDS